MASQKRQAFIQHYKQTFFYITECKKFVGEENEKNRFYAHCTLCNTDIYIGSGGASDIKKHAKGLKHKDKEEGHRNAARFKTQMENRKESNETLKKMEEEETLKNDTIKAEILLCELIVELNLSMASADTLSSAMKEMFPDSVIAQKFSCARTKATHNVA